MRNLATSLLAFVVLCSGTCHANEFFNGLVGHWKYVTKTTVADDNNSTFRYVVRLTFRLLRSGVVYQESRGVIDGQQSLGKGWIYPKGTLRGVTYLDGEKVDQAAGTWRMRSGKLFVKTSGKDGQSDAVWRRVSNDKYVIKMDSSGGSRTTATLTRIRN